MRRLQQAGAPCEPQRDASLRECNAAANSHSATPSVSALDVGVVEGRNSCNEATKQACRNWARSAECRLSIAAQRVYQRLVPPTPRLCGRASTAFPGSQNSKMRSPRARFSSAQHGRPRHGHQAMPHDRRDSGNPLRVKGTAAQDTRDSPDHAERPFVSRRSPRPAASTRAHDCSRERSRGSDATLAVRDRRRDNHPRPHHLPPRSSSPDQPLHATVPPRHGSYEPFPYSSRQRRRRRDSLPRDRETARTLAFNSAPPQAPARTHIDPIDQRPPRSPAPLAREHTRRRSPFADNSQPRRLRQDQSLRRPRREPHHAGSAFYAPPSDRSSPHRDTVPTRRGHPRSKRKPSRASSPLLPDRGRSPSAPLDSEFAENPNLVPLGHRPSSRHDLGPEPTPAHHRLSRPETQTSAAGQRDRGFSNPYIDIDRRQTPDSVSRERSRQQTPLHDTVGTDPEDLIPLDTQRREERLQAQAEPPELASGSNNIQSNMSTRGNFRGHHTPRGHYNQGPHDSRYSQSSSHGTSNSSAQGSPSSHHGGRSNWNGQR